MTTLVTELLLTGTAVPDHPIMLEADVMVSYKNRNKNKNKTIPNTGKCVHTAFTQQQTKDEKILVVFLSWEFVWA